MGQKRIEPFEMVTVDSLRLTITESAGEPDISVFSAFNVAGFSPGEGFDPETEPVFTVSSWNSGTFSTEWTEFKVDLTPYLTKISQYELKFEVISVDLTQKSGLEFKDPGMEMYGKNQPQTIEQVGKGGIFRITRSQQTNKPDEFPTIFRVMIRSQPGKSAGTVEFQRIFLN